MAYVLARWWYAWRRPSRTTAAVALWHKNSLLLVSHSYKHDLTLPGGGARWREAPALAAARELREETGIVIDPESLLLADITTYAGRYGRRTTYLYEVRLPHAPQIRVNGWEITGGSLFDAREACAIGHSAGLSRYIESALARHAA